MTLLAFLHKIHALRIPYDHSPVKDPGDGNEVRHRIANRIMPPVQRNPFGRRNLDSVQNTSASPDMPISDDEVAQNATLKLRKMQHQKFAIL